MIKKVILAVIFVLGIGANIAITAPLKPAPKISPNGLKLIEGQLYCSGGYGTQSNQFRVGQTTVLADKAGSVLIPTFDFQDEVTAGFGCRVNHLFFDYALSSGTVQLEEEVLADSTPYNMIQYEISYYNIGYQVPFIRNALYAAAGLSYYDMQYTLGMYGGSASSDYSSELKQDRKLGAVIKLQWFVNHFFYIHYKYQKSFASDAVLDSSTQLGFNFYSKF